MGVLSGSNFHQELKTKLKIQDFVNSKHMLKNPICKDCLEGVVKEYSDLIELNEKDGRMYEESLKELMNEYESGDINDLERQLEKLTNEERQLDQKIANVHQQESNIDKKSQELQA